PIDAFVPFALCARGCTRRSAPLLRMNRRRRARGQTNEAKQEPNDCLHLSDDARCRAPCAKVVTPRQKGGFGRPGRRGAAEALATDSHPQLVFSLTGANSLKTTPAPAANKPSCHWPAGQT